MAELEITHGTSKEKVLRVVGWEGGVLIFVGVCLVVVMIGLVCFHVGESEFLHSPVS